MKSNEEFIAGIYEKAAAYTEEKKTNIIRVNFAAKAMRMAAMFAVCLGLAGVGVMTLGNHGSEQMPDGGQEGIALSSFEDEPFYTPMPRTMPELSYVDGEVEAIDKNHGLVFVRLRDMTAEEIPATEPEFVVIRFAEGIDLIDNICKGMQIKVGGATIASGYVTEQKEYTLLLVTRKQDFFVWSEESQNYAHPDFVSEENE